MNFLSIIANHVCLWEWYFIICGSISIIAGISNLIEQYIKQEPEIENKSIQNETDKKKKSKYITRYKRVHALHFAMYHALSIAFGFLLIFFEIQLLNFLTTTSSRWNVAIVGILFIIVLFYSIFCIAGRGIEILNKISKPGLKRIHIGWTGIALEFFDKEKN